MGFYEACEINVDRLGRLRDEIYFFIRGFPRGINGLQWNKLGSEFEDECFSWLASLGSSGSIFVMFPNMKELWKRILEWIFIFLKSHKLY